MIPQDIQDRIQIIAKINGPCKILRQDLEIIVMNNNLDVDSLIAFCDEKGIEVYDINSLPDPPEIEPQTPQPDPIWEQKRQDTEYVVKVIMHAAYIIALKHCLDG